MRAAVAIAGAAVALCACNPRRPPPQRVSLDCPPVQGELKRTSVEGDGRACGYVSAEGDEVSLRLVPVGSAGAEAALAPIEQSLVAETRTAHAANAAAPAGEADRARNEARADTGLAEADKDVDADVQTGPNHVKVDLPGIHVAADESGAKVKVGGIAVDAGGSGAVVRTAQDVRLRGEAFSRVKRGYRANFVMAKDDLPGGWAAVGYEAAGPRVGPLAVAVIHSRSSGSDRLNHAVRALVRRNGDV